MHKFAKTAVRLRSELDRCAVGRYREKGADSYVSDRDVLAPGIVKSVMFPEMYFSCWRASPMQSMVLPEQEVC